MRVLNEMEMSKFGYSNIRIFEYSNIRIISAIRIMLRGFEYYFRVRIFDYSPTSRRVALGFVGKIGSYPSPRARFKVIDSLNAAKTTKYSLVMTPMPRYRVAGCIISVRPTILHIRAPVHLLSLLTFSE